MNPLLAEWHTPYGLPPFDTFKPEHFAAALHSAMRSHRDELQLLAEQAEPPSFDNTLARFDRSGQALSRVSAVFYNLTASHTNPELQAVQRDMAAPMAAHSSAIYMNEALFRRVHLLHEQSEKLGLNPEQLRLLQRVHLDFVRAGALLAAAEQQRYAQIMQRLAQLTTAFGQNVLHDEGAFQLVLRDVDALAGLPDALLATARQAAVDRGLGEGHVITLSRSLIVPFLTFSERRDLREQAWRAWVGRGEHDGPHDNRPVAVEILQLRAEQARLLGADSYADHALQDTMAGDQAAVQRLLDEVWPRALAAAAAERDLLLAQRHAAQPDDDAPLQPWDWRYWAEKVRREHFNVDDAQVKPYFSLPRMVKAAFDCAHRLFGL
ncbi:MAG: M3 family metallopeptidase, partial [Rubrivivax sp.]